MTKLVRLDDDHYEFWDESLQKWLLPIHKDRLIKDKEIVRLLEYISGKPYLKREHIWELLHMLGKTYY